MIITIVKKTQQGSSGWWVEVLVERRNGKVISLGSLGDSPRSALMSALADEAVSSQEMENLLRSLLSEG